MNMINSLILEGVVVGEPHYLESTHRLEFVVDTERLHKSESGENVTEHYQFEVIGYGESMRVFLPKLKNGAGVRVVGRLKQDKWEDSDGVTHSKVYDVAEHIEIRFTK